MRFEVHLSSRSHKFLKKTDKRAYERLTRNLETLADNPFPSEAKKIMGRKEKLLRIRVGDYRILYEVYLDKNVILVVNIDKRSRVYKR